MELIETSFDGLWLIQPKKFQDNRGYFYESFNQILFNTFLPSVTFLQDNQSQSKKNVLRGLHFQISPFEQVKLVRVVKGAVRDIAVDLRENSKTYGKHFKIELSEKNSTMLWIPGGFAHGFITLEDDTVFLYKCSNVYHKASERCIVWNDPDLEIDWGITNPIISEKDMQGAHFKEIASLL
jgi:dTDP-4-dehydrorhamnose 3,5-epimerase